MKTFVLLLLVYDAAAVYRLLEFFFTASSGVTHFPEFVVVGQVDGVQLMCYDNNTRRAEPKHYWMDKVTADDPEIWEAQTQILRGEQQNLKGYIEILKQLFNQTGGVHVLQGMYGCEWDDESGDTDGFWQYAYNGEDFISLDLKTLTYVAAKPQAVAIKHTWDNNKAWLEHRKNFLTQTCMDWLKKYLNYGRSFLLRTERPSVSLLQRTPSSPVSCFATGFVPDRAIMFWRKDGEELHEDVEMGELLPNHDGTFQMSADLTLPEDAEDLHKYECVFQLSGIEEDLVYRLDRSSIKTNHRNPYTFHIIGGVIACLVLAVVIGIVWKYCR